MRKPLIHINCDLGEGIGNETAIMPLISSCNIACGGHFGDEKSIHDTLLLAQAHNIEIGAHPSYQDIKNFGRKVLNISSKELFDSVLGQVTVFLAVCKRLGVTMDHIKAHGALYNETMKNREVAQVLIDVLKTLDEQYTLYVPYGSVISEMAVEQKVKIQYEVFVDRNYRDDWSLVPRTQMNALVDRNEIINQVKNFVNRGTVKTVSGSIIPTQADTYCVHGDNADALNILIQLHQHFDIVK